MGWGLFFKLHMFCTSDVTQEKQLSMYQCCLRLNKTLISQNAEWMGLWDALAWAGRPQKTILPSDISTELITISYKSVSVEPLPRFLLWMMRTAGKGSDIPPQHTHTLLLTPLSWKSLERGKWGPRSFFTHLVPAPWEETLIPITFYLWSVSLTPFPGSSKAQTEPNPVSECSLGS